MRVKVWKLLLALAVMGISSLAVTSNSQAADAAPGEGAYVGAFVGFGMGVLQAKVASQTVNDDTVKTYAYETDRGGFGLSGIQGGGWIGYGLKTADDLYLGFELSAAASDEKIKLTTNAIKAETETERYFQFLSLSEVYKKLNYKRNLSKILINYAI